MITTSLNTQGRLGLIASGYEVAPSLLAYTLRSPSGLSGGCSGPSSKCKKSRVSIAGKPGCGCSGLSGCNGLAGLGRLGECYGDGSCYDAATGVWSYPDETAAWNATSGSGAGANVNTTVDYTKYFRDILLPKQTYPTGNVPTQATPRPATTTTDSDVPWPLIALLGAGLLLAVAS